MAAEVLLGRTVSDTEYEGILRDPKGALTAAANVNPGEPGLRVLLEGVQWDAVSRIPEVQALLEFVRAPHPAAW